MRKPFLLYILNTLLCFFLGIASSYAMHGDDPVVLVTCSGPTAEKDAMWIIGAYQSAVKDGENPDQFYSRLQRFLPESCQGVNIHHSELDDEARNLTKTDTPAIWSGPALVGSKGWWTYFSWHIAIATFRKGLPNEKTYHVVILKKADAPVRNDPNVP